MERDDESAGGEIDVTSRDVGDRVYEYIDVDDRCKNGVKSHAELLLLLK